MQPRPTPRFASPYASILRHRATALRSFAGTLDQLLVTHIGAEELPSSAAHTESRHWILRQHLLDHNLHQLHRAADELREVAHQMWQAADSLELAHISTMPPGV
jgi:hypothetical protein